mgnify:FL=1
MTRLALSLLVVALGVAGSVEAKTVEHRRVLDCGTRTSAECSEAVVAALGHGPGFKLKADTPDDTVHGSVTIQWCDPMPCAVTILVEVYEQDDPPNARRKSHLKRSSIMPSETEIRRRLDTFTLP